MNDIIVSICCITYNHEKYIAHALESFVKQKTDFKFEVIVHDDVSTDNTRKIIDSYVERYPEIIRTIYQVENQYSKGVRIMDNIVVPTAKGKYIAICEGDDFWNDDYKLQKQVDYMESHPECTLCIHNSLKVDLEGKQIGQINTVEKSRIVSCEEVILGDGAFCSTNSIMMPKKIMESLPQYLEIISNDYAKQIYCASQGTCYCFADVMSAYRVGVEGSWSKRVKANRLKHAEYTEIVVKMLKEFDEYTEKRYSPTVEVQLVNFELKIKLIREQYREILRSNRLRNCINKKGVKRRVIIYTKILLGCFAPKLVDLIQKVKK